MFILNCFVTYCCVCVYIHINNIYIHVCFKAVLILSRQRRLMWMKNFHLEQPFRMAFYFFFFFGFFLFCFLQKQGLGFSLLFIFISESFLFFVLFFKLFSQNLNCNAMGKLGFFFLISFFFLFSCNLNLDNPFCYHLLAGGWYTGQTILVVK